MTWEGPMKELKNESALVKEAILAWRLWKEEGPGLAGPLLLNQ